jgi:hypothetical protein
MSGVVKIVIRETAAELKTLLAREKDAMRHEKLLLLYWFKTKTVDSVLSAAVRYQGERITHRERVTFAMSIYTQTFLRLPIKPFK